jgi:hypothetical protein
MARFPKTNADDSDSYNEEALSRDLDESGPEKRPVDPEAEDILPELGETDRHDRFDRRGDEELFGNRQG